jgi:UDP-2,3-diacylglucosamine pyrophosphatase LpxH
MNGFLYVNTGDFVESCTAIVEHHDGSLELLRWQTREHLAMMSSSIETNKI